ncbi:MAG: 50S ribosomal protein L21 [Candidatus Margulisiibacteriota bacterium]
MSIAVIETGSKQYKVEAGSVISIEKLELEPKASVTFDKVLLVSGEKGLQVGKPYLEGAKVVATVLGQEQADKVLVFKFKPKTGYKRTQGHRQKYTTVRIESITA